jgi:alkylation response protein AidB-like acyl-CoA dehydrogenase
VNAELFLDDAFVPDANRIGEEGQGFVGLMRTFDKSRIVLASGCVGIARAAYEYAAKYARERVQFGKPIIENQAIAFMLADMAVSIEASRLLVWRAAWMARQGKRFEQAEGCRVRLRGLHVATQPCRRSAAGARASTSWRSGSAT